MAILPKLKKPYTLLCKTPPTGSEALVESFAGWAQRYRHTIRNMGGYWEASWWFPLKGDITRTYLREWFENRLGYRHQERIGGAISWQGTIWEMELTLDGAKRRRSVGEVWNAIKMKYTDTTGANQDTGWYTKTSSINRYGRRELILSADEISADEAVAAVNTELTRSAEAHAQLIDLGRNLESGLLVTAVGDIFTANNKYVTAGDSTNGNVSTYISEIITTDCQFLTAGRIGTNTLQTRKSVGATPMRAWDKILQLTLLGDSNYAPYLFWVDADGRAHYQAADSTPRYEWLGTEGGLQSRLGTQSPWLVWPNVIRDKTRRKSAPIPGTFLTDGRDSWIGEIEMADGLDEPHVKPEGFDEDEILKAQENHLRWLEQEAGR